jgi:hypothetical protein
MAETISLLVLDALHAIQVMQRAFMGITVAGALTMNTNCCNADCYLLLIQCDVGRYLRTFQRNLLV